MSTRGTQTNPARLPDAPSSGVHNTVAPTLNNGDQTALQLDANGNLNVNVQVGGGGGGGTVNQGNQGTAAEGWFVELTDGTNVLGTSTYPVRVDPTGTTTQPVSISATLSDNIAQWGGTAVSAPPASGVPAVGTEVAPVVKPIQRKNGVPNASPTAILTTTPLAANGNYTSSWVDTFQTGDHFVQAVAYPGSIASASNGFQIQSTDDTSNTQTQTNLRTTIYRDKRIGTDFNHAGYTTILACGLYQRRYASIGVRVDCGCIGHTEQRGGFWRRGIRERRWCHGSDCGPRFAGFTLWSCGWCGGKRSSCREQCGHAGWYQHFRL